MNKAASFLPKKYLFEHDFKLIFRKGENMENLLVQGPNAHSGPVSHQSNDHRPLRPSLLNSTASHYSDFIKKITRIPLKSVEIAKQWPKCSFRGPYAQSGPGAVRDPARFCLF